MKLEFGHEARSDLFSIWQHLADIDPSAADRLTERLRARVQLLRQFPDIGVARPDIRDDVRMLVEAPYLILYRVMPDTVQVVRVVHGARDITADNFTAGPQ